MKDKPANVPASAAARLRNVARSKNTSFDIVLKRYGLEGLIRRLSASPHRDNFILKGAMLFTVWLDDPFRPTQDLDLLGYGDSAVDTIANTFRQICTQDADDDGLIFDVRNLVAHAIREDQQYGGVRVRTKASLGKIQIPIQVDIGFGDVVTPQAVPVEFPALLSKSGPRIRAYPRPPARA